LSFFMGQLLLNGGKLGIIINLNIRYFVKITYKPNEKTCLLVEVQCQPPPISWNWHIIKVIPNSERT
jgi:hypothetical protein